MRALKFAFLASILLLLCSIKLSAQEPALEVGSKKGAVRVPGRLYVDSALFVPFNKPLTWTPLRPGELQFNIIGGDSSFYGWNGGRFRKLAYEDQLSTSYKIGSGLYLVGDSLHLGGGSFWHDIQIYSDNGSSFNPATHYVDPGDGTTIDDVIELNPKDESGSRWYRVKDGQTSMIEQWGNKIHFSAPLGYRFDNMPLEDVGYTYDRLITINAFTGELGYKASPLESGQSGYILSDNQWKKEWHRYEAESDSYIGLDSGLVDMQLIYYTPRNPLGGLTIYNRPYAGYPLFFDLSVGVSDGPQWSSQLRGDSLYTYLYHSYNSIGRYIRVYGDSITISEFGGLKRGMMYDYTTRDTTNWQNYTLIDKKYFNDRTSSFSSPTFTSGLTKSGSNVYLNGDITIPSYLRQSYTGLNTFKVIAKPFSGNDSTFLELVNGGIYIKSRTNLLNQYSSFSNVNGSIGLYSGDTLGTNWKQLDITPASIKFSNLASTTDTTNYKPAVFDASGNLKAFTYWPSQPVSPTPTLEQVLTAGSSLSTDHDISYVGSLAGIHDKSIMYFGGLFPQRNISYNDAGGSYDLVIGLGAVPGGAAIGRNLYNVSTTTSYPAWANFEDSTSYINAQYGTASSYTSWTSSDSLNGNQLIVTPRTLKIKNVLTSDGTENYFFTYNRTTKQVYAKPLSSISSTNIYTANGSISGFTTREFDITQDATLEFLGMTGVGGSVQGGKIVLDTASLTLGYQQTGQNNRMLFTSAYTKYFGGGAGIQYNSSDRDTTSWTDYSLTDRKYLNDRLGNLSSVYFPLTGGDITGTGGAGYIGLIPQTSNPATPSSGVRLYSRSTGAISWKGTNGYQRSFIGTGITNDRDYTLPDTSGTLIVGTGTANRLSYWTATNTQTSGSLYSDGNYLGIGAAPATNEIFNVTSTTKGSTPAPVMTQSQVNAISSPVQGLQAYVSDASTQTNYDGEKWRRPSNILYNFSSNITVSGTASGDWILYKPGSTDNISISTTTFYVLPISVSNEGILSKLRIQSGSTSGTGTFRIGIYNSTSDGFPNTLVDSATITVTAGSTQYEASTIGKRYKPGLYWYGCVVTSAGGSLRGISTTTGAGIYPRTTQTQGDMANLSGEGSYSIPWSNPWLPQNMSGYTLVAPCTLPNLKFNWGTVY